MKNHILFFISLFIFQSLSAQITVETSTNTYTLKISERGFNRRLSFRKDADSIAYHELNYSVSPSGKNNLSDETRYIKKLLDIARDSIRINLRSANVGYPNEYGDVLVNQIKAFNKSTKWQAHVKKNGKQLNYSLILEVMKGGNIYAPLDTLLRSYGYKIDGYSNEKYGFVEKDKLIKKGFTGKEVVPVPFMVYIRVKKV